MLGFRSLCSLHRHTLHLVLAPSLHIDTSTGDDEDPDGVFSTTQVIGRRTCENHTHWTYLGLTMGVRQELCSEERRRSRPKSVMCSDECQILAPHQESLSVIEPTGGLGRACAGRLAPVGKNVGDVAEVDGAVAVGVGLGKKSVVTEGFAKELIDSI